MPLGFNQTNGEPFIRLPSPHQNITITPSRPTDGPSACEIHNNPAVYMKLVGPPFPYTQACFDSWYLISSKIFKDALKEYLAFEEAKAKGEEPKWAGSGAPVGDIREFDEKTGKEVFLGNIMIRRYFFQDVGDEGEKTRLKEINDGLEAGDPNIQWEIGFYLSPTTHGRGIMSAALRTMMDSFYIPYMNAHFITGSWHDTNIASRRVFEKTGFVFEKILPDWVELSEAKTGVKGQKVGLGFTRWVREL